MAYGNMKEPEKYWTYKSGPIPEIDDLPEGTFSGPEKDWNKLSPGMKREIYKQAVKRLELAAVV